MQDFLESSEKYRRPEASWRRMLIQQPPIMALGWAERNVSPSEGTDLHRWEIPLQALGGLKMNMLYDLVVNTSEALFQSPMVAKSMFAVYQFVQDRWVTQTCNAGCGSGSRYVVYKSNDISEWSKDTWTRELVRELKLAIDDVDIDLMRYMIDLKEFKSWNLAEELGDIARERGLSTMVCPFLMRTTRPC
ncbi:hypothetical protein N7520_008452 [Penicillium odoratum]|uniref:uncharacterized protein n=1 Tax=Penicillium odoratum TaxID=1167516 RepID=UPI00254903E4|nr:uncharacterized protein N7520_008452 [Penicillium odoratum]KAJ5761296.1 hypothetical protein N7520_008452 [Penicillium odoratum]